MRVHHVAGKMMLAPAPGVGKQGEWGGIYGDRGGSQGEPGGSQGERGGSQGEREGSHRCQGEQGGSQRRQGELGGSQGERGGSHRRRVWGHRPPAPPRASGSVAHTPGKPESPSPLHQPRRAPRTK